MFFETVPVQQVNDNDNKVFTSLVEQIQELKKKGKSSSHLEDEIETKLAAFYSLSDEDKKLIYSVDEQISLENPE